MRKILVLSILITVCGISARAQYTGGPGQGYAMSNTVLNEILPVTWLEFRATVQDGDVVLHWSTAAELNNDFFEVQHSSNGIGFTPIGTVGGSGTTRQISRYSFTDTNPQIGTNYYRLRQVDFDGQFDYSPILSAVFADNRDLALELYPNPASSMLNVVLPYAGAAALTVYNSAGQAVITRKLGSDRQASLDVSGLRKGLYALVCKMGALSLSGRFVVE